ncbi:hypothetical protein V2A60_005453 [Cordyceps javanica]
MSAISPTKRRAALATLDANAMNATTPTAPGKHAEADTVLTKTLPASRRSSGILSSAPVLAPPVVSPAARGSIGGPSVGMKRAGMVLQDRDATGNRDDMHEDEEQHQHQQQTQQQQQQQPEQANKRSKLGHADTPAPAPTQSSTATTARSRTHSPDASSVFDASGAEDATWVTTATEPDLVGPFFAAVPTTPPVRARALTREQAREKMEIIRLRLGLASYKLRTGQVEVPLADLQPRPLPAAASLSAATVENTPESSQGGATQEEQDEGEEQGEEQAEEGEEGEEEVEVIEATPPPSLLPSSTAAAALATMAPR